MMYHCQIPTAKEYIEYIIIITWRINVNIDKEWPNSKSVDLPNIPCFTEPQPLNGFVDQCHINVNVS